MKRALVCGAGGFIGNHLVSRLKSLGYWVRGVDLKRPEYGISQADEFLVYDLREQKHYPKIFAGKIDEVFQLAADMGGAGYIFTGLNDANIIHNSAMINLNVADYCHKKNVDRVFFSSSACIYPERNQQNPDSPDCSEDSAYPAAPDSEYGWEKIFSERLYLAFHKNHNLKVRIARFHNIFGEFGTWNGGREKAPAAICRKVAEAKDGGTIEIWGDGKQTRSFLHIDECLDGVLRLMNSDLTGPFNIGSEEMVSINELAEIVMHIAGKNLKIKHIEGPNGVRGRNSHNKLIKKSLGWAPSQRLHVGLEKTYKWISEQVASQHKKDQPKSAA